MQTIYLDISNRGVIPVIYAKQGDVGRKVEIVLTNSGLPYEPEAGSAFSAWFSGASGVGNYTDIGDQSAFTVSGNKVTVELITQMLQNAGEGVLCLVLSRSNGDQIGLWNIRYICEGVPGAGSEPAKDYYTAFSQAVAGLAYPDASLSVAGKAADAAATGKALEGKAPAGYGYGEPCVSFYHTSSDSIAQFESALDEFVAEMKDGEAKQICVTCIGITNTTLYGTIYRHTEQYVIVTLTTYYQNGSVVKCKFGGVWEPHGWNNPPMIPGVEYRTTERWNGKAVYARLLNLGNAINGSRITIPGCTKLIRHVGFIGSDAMPVWTGERKNPYYFAESCILFTDVKIETDALADGFGSGGHAWSEHLWYTKD